MNKKGLKIWIAALSLLLVLASNIQTVKAFQPDTMFSYRLKIIEKNIPYQLTEELQDAIFRKMYTEKSESELILTRSIESLPFIEKELWQNDLPSEFKYIPVAMSGLNPTHITYNGGAGIWGLQYIIAKKYGLDINEIEDERRDQIKSTCTSIHYIQDLQKNYGNWTLTLLAFITSPSDVNSAICRSGNSSDPWKIYAQMSNKQKGLFIDFIASAYLLNYYDAHGLEKKQPDFEWANCSSFPVEQTMSFADLSAYLGVPENTLKQANPTIRSHYIPGNQGYVIRIPNFCNDKYCSYKPIDVTNLAVVQNQSNVEPTVTNNGTEVNTNISGNTTQTVVTKSTNTPNVTKSSTGSYQTQKSYYKVKSGDNLGKIAGKYNVSVSSIKSWNGLKNDKIYVGQKICIHKKVWVAAKTTEVVTTSDENTNVTVVDTKTNNDQVNSNTLVKNDTENITTVTKEPEVKTNITPNKTTTITKSWVTYKVQKGDTLWKIANKHGVTVDDVKNNNNISGDKIIIGQVLKIKSK